MFFYEMFFLFFLASARYHSSLQLFKFDRTEKFKIQ